MINKFKLKKKKKYKKKKGFTLVELLAVIVILAVIMVITIPTVIGSMNNAKEKAEDVFVASIERSLNKFIENELMFSDYNFSENKQEYTTKNIDGKYKIVEVVKAIDNSPLTFDDFDSLGYYPKSDLVNPKNGEKCNVEDFHVYKDKNKDNTYYYSLKLDCLDSGFSNLPPEEPDLSTGFIPVKWCGSNNAYISGWCIADPKTEWYNYDNLEWANAILLDPEISSSDLNRYKDGDSFNVGVNLYNRNIKGIFVWIPRFSYTIGCHETNNCLGYRLNDGTELDSTGKVVPLDKNSPGAIDIKFVPQVVTDNLKEGISRPSYNYDINGVRTPDNWYTHPAFTFGEEELSGIWVGKFLSSGDFAQYYNSTDGVWGVSRFDLKITHKVTDDYDYGNINITNKYLAAYHLAANEFVSGITNVNSHVMKNTEWSAVAYLSQSKFGKYGNSKYTIENNLEYKIKEIYLNDTIYCGGGQVYYNNINSSMSTTGNQHGVYDMNTTNGEYIMGNFSSNLGTSGFIKLPYLKYYSLFNNTNINGYAFFETAGWYGNLTSTFSSSKPWIIRGKNGIFSYSSHSGNKSSTNQSFRISVVKY